MAERY